MVNSERVIVHTGDNLPILKTLPDNSVDAIVTDPPYGLNDGAETLQDVFFAKFFDVFFPQFNKLVPGLLNQGQFSLPPERTALLDFVNRAIDVHSRVGVPEGSIDFNDCIVDWNEKIKDAYKSSFTVPHGVLSDEADPRLEENGFDFTLQLRRCFDAPLSDSAAVGITECGFGRLGVLVVIHPQSLFASFLRSNSPSQPSGIADIIGLLTDPARLAESASKVMTSRGTELRAMLAFDSTSGTCELVPASSTRQIDAVFELVPTQGVRALTGAGGLASMFQALRVSEIKNVTARAFTLNVHKFIIPYLSKHAKGFMGKRWDADVPPVELWMECLRVLKPGGHLLAFAGTRTQHKMTTNIEKAGFEIRDMLAFIHGQGFPKSTNISKQIDRMAGAEREVVSEWRTGFSGTLGGKAALGGLNGAADVRVTTAPATDAAKQWDGYGTALKPAMEPITLARKPIEKGLNIAQNVLKWGTGGLNIDKCRIATDGERPQGSGNPIKNAPREAIQPGRSGGNGGNTTSGLGRWPAHLIHDGSEEVEAVFPVTGPSGTSGSPQSASRSGNAGLSGLSSRGIKLGHGDSGSASRFFYCAKPGKSERDAGLAAGGNVHPTVKALKLMTYLCRLITPPDGLILDPFTGSGSTGCAAMLEGFRFIGMEQSPEYAEIALRRIEYWLQTSVQYKVDTNEQQMSILDVIDES